MSHKVLALISDMFFAIKVEQTAKLAGVPLILMHSAESLMEAMKKEQPSLLIIDLNFDAQKSIEVIKASRLEPNRDPTKIVAFLSHVQTDLANLAKRAGADVVLPRSAFSKNLPEILKGKI